MGLGVMQLSECQRLADIIANVQTEMERLAQRFPTGLKYR